MKISELLRGMADAMDQQEHDRISKPAEKQADEPELDDMGKFIPPLQSKHEMLKKATGIDSEYDDEESEEDKPSPELMVIKKLAGLMHTEDDFLG